LDSCRPRTGGRRKSLGGKHFHHYNIGIALLTSVGAVGLRGSEEQVGLIAAGGTVLAGMPFWPYARRALRHS
jgi:hypothetical protein